MRVVKYALFSCEIYRNGSCRYREIMNNNTPLPKSDSRKNAICFWQKKCVLVSFEIVSIGEIDMMNERYQGEVIIESKWLITDKMTDLKMENYDPKAHWNPELYIENALNNVREQIKYAVSKVENDYYVTEFRLIKGNFWQRVELENFPVDVQELSIVLTTKHSSDEIYLISDPDKFSYINLDASNTFYEQQKWSLFKLVKISETAAYDLRKKSKRKGMHLKELLTSNRIKPPKIVATCYSARKPGFYFLNAYFLVFLITFIAFPVFSIDIKSPHFRLATSYTILLTSVSFKWVLNDKMPSVSNFTLLDKYQISSISFVCLIIIWHSLVGTFWDRKYGELLDLYFLCIFGFLFFVMQSILGIWIYYAYGKKRQIQKEELKFLQIFNERALKHDKLSFDRLSIECNDDSFEVDDYDTDNLTTVVCTQ